MPSVLLNKQELSITKNLQEVFNPHLFEINMKYKDIKFFLQRCEEHPDHQSGMITHQMLLDRLHEEVDELREYIETNLKEKHGNN